MMSGTGVTYREVRCQERKLKMRVMMKTDLGEECVVEKVKVVLRSTG